MPVTWSDEKLILLCPGRGSNSRPSARHSVNMIKVSHALTTGPRRLMMMVMIILALELWMRSHVTNKLTVSSWKKKVSLETRGQDYINVFRAWIGAQLTICAQKWCNFVLFSTVRLTFVLSRVLCFSLKSWPLVLERRSTRLYYKEELLRPYMCRLRNLFRFLLRTGSMHWSLGCSGTV